ncbi:MAG: glycosyltransferase family 4 protein [Deltaproteobacteria bacterium]|nr:glycosyltransferase family 4 protein [Deltaproteobacteria bacterium]
MIIGIDASRNRSGGAIAHVVGIISAGNPLAHGIREVHVWAYKKLLDALPDLPWLFKHNPPELERSLFHQMWWQFRSLAKSAKASKCDVLFSSDASTFCRFRPLVVMSQDMLQYEPGAMRHFGLSKKRLKMIALLLVQNRAMRFADGVIFLTQYTAKLVQKKLGLLNRIEIIPHGIDEVFKEQQIMVEWPCIGERSIRCVYVSHVEMYKHQWVVVKAIAELRRQGCNINLTLIGGGSGHAQELLYKQLLVSDPQRLFVEIMGFVNHDKLPELLANSDLFVFASSCENLPITLLEAMAVGLPIACSNRGPMPDVLKDAGIYFDPEDLKSVVEAIEKIIIDADLRTTIAKRAKELSHQYSWDRCSAMTYEFLASIGRGNAKH